MHRVAKAAGVLLALACAGLLSCGCHVRLTGQRISMRYDDARDELRFLIFYDGVHCPDEKGLDQARQQLRAFARNGSFALPAWPLRFDLASIGEAAADERTPPAARALARLAAQVIRLETLGRYCDPDGRMGVGQRVVVSQARKVLERVNAALNEMVLARTGGESSVPRNWPLTYERWIAAARAGHPWLRLDGQALRVSVPVHPGEWDRNKGRGLLDLLREWRAPPTRPDETAAQRRERERREHRTLENTVQALTAASFSLLQTRGEVTLILGDPKHPSTFRLGTSDTYGPHLEATLTELVPTRLDRVLAQHLLEAPSPPPPTPTPLGDLLEWGPPEMRVMALVGLLEKPDRADRARRALAEFARRWNREQRFPKAPTDAGDTRAPAKAWRAWARRMWRYPLPEAERPPASPPAGPTKPPAPPGGNLHDGRP